MSENYNNFDNLKKLLKLKKHEIPPPAYYNNFSKDVIARIRAGEAGGYGNFFERLQADSPFFAALLGVIQSKPGLLGGMATGVCLILLFSVLLADRPDADSPGTVNMAGTSQTESSSASDTTPNLASTLALEPASEGGITVSSNPVVSLQPSATLFGSQDNPLFQPVGFVPAKQ